MKKGAPINGAPSSERQSIQVRAEAFNLPNHVNLVTPGGAGPDGLGRALTYNSSNFGQITSRPDPDLLRGYNGEYNASIQHELAPSLSVTGGYYRRNFSNLEPISRSMPWLVGR